MKSFVLVFPIVLAMYLGLTGFSVSNDISGGILSESKAKLESLDDFSAGFKYSITNPNMRPVAKNGSIKYKKGKYVISLDDQKIFCNSKTLWIYLPEVNEVSIMSYTEDEGINVESIFKIYESSTKSRYEGENEIHGVVCHKIFMAIQSDELDYNQAYVWINKKTKFLEKVVLVDRKQTQTIYEFYDIKTNVGFGDVEFEFDPKQYRGVNIYDERS
ncbi:MAG: outer membrane lipoprotein carrier protein LolA [Bacteroidia bacterium]|nr:outer membrane lipoprotein carrier protein LolA [Bacteroidia bacterium]